MICDIFPDDELGKNLGLIMSANGVGMLLGPVFGGLLYDKFGFASSFYVVIALSLIDAFMRFMLLSDEVRNM
jgi:DHA1 family solute carrier family 18 vesicular amine transporter 1/2